MEKRTVWEHLLAAFYPERCCCCGKVIACGEIICRRCHEDLIAINPPVCSFCGRSKADCGCHQHQRHTQRCVAPFYYQGSAKKALMRLKFNNKIASAELLILGMTETIQREYKDVQFDFIVPVPVSVKTKEKRGYNQSALLAKGLSKKLDLPWNETLLKLWDTQPQRELPAYRRSGNVLGAFDIDGKVDINDKTVLLVDDINTTGSTLNECAKILKIHGANEVYAVTAAASYLSKKEK